jgi:N-acetylmuramoyl-L-alanine amidase
VNVSDLGTQAPAAPGSAGFKPYLVKVTASLLNVRAGAGLGYKIKTTVRHNEVYTIVEEKNGWGKLKSGAGWINLGYAKKI